MKQPYGAFAGDDAYPQGGMKDWQGTFYDYDVARNAVQRFDWWQIVDMQDMQVVDSSDNYPLDKFD